MAGGSVARRGGAGELGRGHGWGEHGREAAPAKVEASRRQCDRGEARRGAVERVGAAASSRAASGGDRAAAAQGTNAASSSSTAFPPAIPRRRRHRLAELRTSLLSLDAAADSPEASCFATSSSLAPPP
ncbi:unnamed protein product [Urochloa humidicola]